MEAGTRLEWPVRSCVNDDPYAINVQHVHHLLRTAGGRDDRSVVQAHHVGMNEWVWGIVVCFGGEGPTTCDFDSTAVPHNYGGEDHYLGVHDNEL